MKKGLVVTGCLLFLVFACSPDGDADKLTGRACVMDGDTLMIGGTRRHTKCAEGQIVVLSLQLISRIAPHWEFNDDQPEFFDLSVRWTCEALIEGKKLPGHWVGRTPGLRVLSSEAC